MCSETVTICSLNIVIPWLQVPQYSLQAALVMSDDAWGMTVTADGRCQLLSPVCIVLLGKTSSP